MTSPKGFGKDRSKKKSSSPNAAKRKAAATQYDQLKQEGFPEFNIYVRVPDKPNSWLPVGSMAVKRSNLINQAIFQNEEDLLKGALRLFPKLARQVDQLEYGYRLKDKLYQDEPITPAERPTLSGPQKLIAAAQTRLRQLLERFAPKS